MADLNLGSIIWSAERYTTSQLLHECKDKFPVVVRISKAYSGEGVEDSFDKGEICCFSRIGTQRRVVAKDLHNRTVTIPLNYPIKFELKSSTGFSNAKSLVDLFDFHNPPFVVRFDRNRSKDFYLNKHGLHADGPEFKELQVKWDYYEKFLQGVRIVPGAGTYSHPVVMPCHVDALLRIGTGMQGASVQYWNHFRRCYNLNANALKHPSLAGNPSIIVINKEPSTHTTEAIYKNMSMGYGVLRNTLLDQQQQQRNSGFHDYVNSYPMTRTSRCQSASAATEDVEQVLKQLEIATHIYYNDVIDQQSSEESQDEDDGHHSYENTLPDGAPMLPPRRKTQRSASDPGKGIRKDLLRSGKPKYEYTKHTSDPDSTLRKQTLPTSGYHYKAEVTSAAGSNSHSSSSTSRKGSLQAISPASYKQDPAGFWHSVKNVHR